MGSDYRGLLVSIVAVIPYVFASLFLVLCVAEQKGRSGFGWALTAVPELEVDDQPVDADIPEFKWRKGAD